MSCSKCIYIISSNCLTWQSDPLSSAWLMFSQAYSGGQGYKSAMFIWWGPSLPRKHLQASACASADHPSLWDHMRSGRLGCLRGKQCLALSSPALAPKEAGSQEWQCKKQSWGDLTTSCSPSTVIFFHFSGPCLVALCWAHLSQCLVSFAVMVTLLECSGCFQLRGQLCSSIMLATSLQPLAGLQQAPHPLSAFLTPLDV